MAPIPIDPALKQMATPTTKPAEISPGVKKTDIDNTPKAEGKRKNPNWTIEELKKSAIGF